MPVTIKVADHTSRAWTRKKVPSRKDLFVQSCDKESQESSRVIQCSIPDAAFSESHITSSNNGFVWACYNAYSTHHHLTIRPDDIWFAILSQLNLYINKNAEDLREHFVAHEGQRELVISDVGSIDTFDFGVFARRMTTLLQENVKDPNLRDWIMPSFSTTTVDDRTTAAVLMMGSLQKYFKYSCRLRCGIPSVTLLGERADWEDIQARLEKLDELGSEPANWAALLRPILQRFIQMFDAVHDDAQIKDFWSCIAHVSGGSGPSYLSGWLTAFCFWRNDGVCMYTKREHDAKQDRPNIDLSPPGRGPEVASARRLRRSVGPFQLDDGVYHRVDTNDIPAGYASVPVTVDDNGVVYETKMVAGSLGMLVSQSGEDEEDGVPKLDSVRSLSGWLMYGLI